MPVIRYQRNAPEFYTDSVYDELRFPKKLCLDSGSFERFIQLWIRPITIRSVLRRLRRSGLLSEKQLLMNTALEKRDTYREEDLELERHRIKLQNFQ